MFATDCVIHNSRTSHTSSPVRAKWAVCPWRGTRTLDLVLLLSTTERRTLTLAKGQLASLSRENLAGCRLGCPLYIERAEEAEKLNAESALRPEDPQIKRLEASIADSGCTQQNQSASYWTTSSALLSWTSFPSAKRSGSMSTGTSGTTPDPSLWPPLGLYQPNTGR